MLLSRQIFRRPVSFNLLILPVQLDSVSRTRSARKKSTKAKRKLKASRKEEHRTSTSAPKLAPYPTHYLNPKLFDAPQKQLPASDDQGTSSGRKLRRGRRRFWWITGRITGGLVFCFFGFWLYHREEVPETGRKRFRWVPDWYVDSLSTVRKEIEEARVQQPGAFIPTHPVLEQYLEEMVLSTGLGHLSCEIVVANMGEERAESTSEGSIIFSTEILRAFETNEEILWVLAHELAHVKMKHIAETTSASVLWDILLAPFRWLNQVPILGEVSSPVLRLHELWEQRVSRKHEFEADKIGMMIAAACGIHPQAVIDAAQSLHKFDTLRKAKLRARGRVISHDYLQSHPSWERRIKQMVFLMPEAVRLWEKTLAEKESKTAERKFRCAQYRNFLRTPRRALHQLKSHVAPWLSMDDMKSAKCSWWNRVNRAFDASQSLRTAVMRTYLLRRQAEQGAHGAKGNKERGKRQGRRGRRSHTSPQTSRAPIWQDIVITAGLNSRIFDIIALKNTTISP